MLLDVDLDFLNFLVNPSYKYIKDIIPYIREAYIEEYGEQYREKITNNFNETNYLFLTKIKELENFIQNFQKIIILEAYQTLASKVNLKLEKRINVTGNNHFIEKILLENNITYLDDDKDLTIFHTVLKNYFIKLMDQVDEVPMQQFLATIIQYIDDTKIKLDNIMSIFKTKLELIEDINKRKQEIQINLQRDFIKKHSYLLLNITKKYISKKVDFNIKKIFSVNPNLELYINKGDNSNFDKVFELGSSVYFQERPENKESQELRHMMKKIVLENKNINYDAEKLNLEDNDACLKRMNMILKKDNSLYIGSSALKKLKEELEIYNEKLKEETFKYQYDLDLKSFIDNNICGGVFLLRKSNEKILKYLEKIPLEDLNILGSEIFKKIDNSFELPERKNNIPAACYKPILVIRDNETIENIKIPISYVILRQHLMIFYENKITQSLFYSNLSHECGHISVMERETGDTGIHKEKKYEMLNELINEYINCRVFNKLLHLNILKNHGIEHDSKRCKYQKGFFLIEPFMEHYEEYFKNASIENDISILEKVIGSNLLEEYINIINEFFFKLQKDTISKEKMKYYHEQIEMIKFKTDKRNQVKLKEYYRKIKK